MSSQEQLAIALEVFGDALPDSAKLHELKIPPYAGCPGTESGSIFAFALGASDTDLFRLNQVIERGIGAYEVEPRLSTELFQAFSIEQWYEIFRAVQSEIKRTQQFIESPMGESMDRGKGHVTDRARNTVKVLTEVQMLITRSHPDLE
jgi:hypothetical protein